MTDKFKLDSDPAKIAAHFDREGYALFTGLDVNALTRPFRQALARLIGFKLGEVDPQLKVTSRDALHNELVALHKSARDKFVQVLDCAHNLPETLAMVGHPEIGRVLTAMGCEAASVNWLPRIRMDFPNEHEYCVPDHQDSHFNSGSENSFTLWIPLVDVPEELGPLELRPGSHKLGRLPKKDIPARPYVVLDEGRWQTDYPVVSLPMRYGEAIAFHMDMIHRSGRNTGKLPRVSLQLRYNNLKDKEFYSQGWPATYKIVTKKDEIFTKSNY